MAKFIANNNFFAHTAQLNKHQTNESLRCVGEGSGDYMGMFNSRYRSEPVKKSYEWNHEWDNVIFNNLTEEMLAYRNDFFEVEGNHKQGTPYWWQCFMQAIAFTESSYNPSCRFTEKFIDDSTGQLCESDGLFQLSLGDRFSYPESPTLQTMTTTEDFFDPIRNIKAAMEIMNILIKRDEPLLNYWSSLDPDKSGPETLEKLKELLGE